MTNRSIEAQICTKTPNKKHEIKLALKPCPINEEIQERLQKWMDGRALCVACEYVLPQAFLYIHKEGCPGPCFDVSEVWKTKLHKGQLYIKSDRTHLSCMQMAHIILRDKLVDLTAYVELVDEQLVLKDRNNDQVFLEQDDEIPLDKTTEKVINDYIEGILEDVGGEKEDVLLEITVQDQNSEVIENPKDLVKSQKQIFEIKQSNNREQRDFEKTEWHSIEDKPDATDRSNFVCTFTIKTRFKAIAKYLQEKPQNFFSRTSYSTSRVERRFTISTNSNLSTWSF